MENDIGQEIADLQGRLRQTFMTAAARLEAAMPAVWEAAMDVYQDPATTARALLKSNPYFDGAAPAEFAARSKENSDHVVHHYGALSAGVY